MQASTMVLLAVTLLVLLTASSSAAAVGAAGSSDPTIVAVLTASSPELFRQQAWLHNEQGIVLLTFKRFDPLLNRTVAAATESEFEEMLSSTRSPLLLGDGSEAAFDDNGDLYFQRTDASALEDWVLRFRTKEPRPVAIHDEGIPKVVEERRAARKAHLLALREEREKVLAQPGEPNRAGPFRITLDPGHGGSDPGAVAQGYQEKAFNLDVSNRLRSLLQADRGLWTVQMTRSTDVDVSLSARTTMANNWPADRFISIHTNSFASPSAQGTETYSYAEGSPAAKLRDRIQQEAIKAWGLSNRGSKTENFHVLREAMMPVTLSEMGFITSPVDIVKLSDPTARQEMAAAHLHALQYHFGVGLNLPQELLNEPDQA